MDLAPKNACVPTFVEKLWEILQAKQEPICLEWTEHGQSFIIKDKEALCSSILPKYFKHSNLSSFVRQLNMYNFRKIRLSKSENEFTHVLFRRNQRQLLIGIRRKPSEAEVEFGNQLIDKLGLERAPYHCESDDIVKKEPTTGDSPPSKEMAASAEAQPESQLEQLRYQNNLLWSNYCRGVQITNLAFEKIYKFLAATYFNSNFNRGSPHPNSLPFVMGHLASEEGSMTAEQYQSMIMGVPITAPMAMQTGTIANIVIKKPCFL